MISTGYIGARARALYPWCPRSNHVLAGQLSARHFVYSIAGRHKEKARELTIDKILFRPVRKCPCLGTVLGFLLGNQKYVVLRLVPVPENWTRGPFLETPGNLPGPISDFGDKCFFTEVNFC